MEHGGADHKVEGRMSHSAQSFAKGHYKMTQQLLHESGRSLTPRHLQLLEILADEAAKELQDCVLFEKYTNSCLRMDQEYGCHWERIARIWHDEIFGSLMENTAQMATQFSIEAKEFVAGKTLEMASSNEASLQFLISECTKLKLDLVQNILILEETKFAYEQRCLKVVSALRSEKLNPSKRNAVHLNLSLIDMVHPEPSAAHAAISSSEINSEDNDAIKGPVEDRAQLNTAIEQMMAAEKKYRRAVDSINIYWDDLLDQIKRNQDIFRSLRKRQMEWKKHVLMKFFEGYSRLSHNASSLLLANHDNSSCLVDENSFRLKCSTKSLKDTLNTECEIDLADAQWHNHVLQAQSRFVHESRLLESFMSSLMAIIHSKRQFINIFSDVGKQIDVNSSNSSVLVKDFVTPKGDDIMQEANEPDIVPIACGDGTVNIDLRCMKSANVIVIQEFCDALDSILSKIVRLQQERDLTKLTASEQLQEMQSDYQSSMQQYNMIIQKRKIVARQFFQLLYNPVDSSAVDREASVSTSSIGQALDKFIELEKTGTILNRAGKSEPIRRLAHELAEIQKNFIAARDDVSRLQAVCDQKSGIVISMLSANKINSLQHNSQSALSVFVRAHEQMLSSSASIINMTIEAMDRMADKQLDGPNFNVPFVQDKKYFTVRLFSHGSLQSCLHENPIWLANVRGESSGGTAAIFNAAHNSEANEDRYGPLDRPLERSDERKRSLSKNGENARMGFHDNETIAAFDLQRKFHLEDPEQVLSSYSCALYINNFPCHGRMYLTKNHVCFNGWREAYFVLPYLEIASLEKKNTAIIVPNAIEIISKKNDRAFFASFVFRDECYNHLQMLYTIQTGTAAVFSKAESGINQAPFIDHSDATCGREELPILELPDTDKYIDKYSIIMEQELPCSAKFVFDKLWISSNDILNGVLHYMQDSNVVIDSWDAQSCLYRHPFSSADDDPEQFDGSRQVKYTHNKKYIIGPSAIPAVQIQRYKWVPPHRLIISATSYIKSVPYHDYFQVEIRWVFTSSQNPGATVIQVGIYVHWNKSTWLKKQIESSTASEVKEFVTKWVEIATNNSQRPMTVEEQSTEARQVNPNLEYHKEKDMSALAEDMAKKAEPCHILHPGKWAILSWTAPQTIIIQLGCLVTIIYILHIFTSTINEVKLSASELRATQQDQSRLLQTVLARLGKDDL